jgi:hypothetical protein
MREMREALASLALIVTALGACGGGGSTKKVEQPDPIETSGDDDTPQTPVDGPDVRLAALRTMTDLLTLLVDDIQHITEDQAPSAARCERLADAVSTWGAQHYEAYELADGEGTYAGITERDAGNEELRELARQLAWMSSMLVDLVDQDCLYGSGAYGEILYEYLVAYQGLAHWVQEGDTATWDYEMLLEEAERTM